MADYFSFEDVMKELELSEDDLKRMVSEGELRAFRDENKMKFKKEDVDNLKKGRITEPTIILPSTPGGNQDETVLDLDIGQETAELKAQSGKDDDLVVQQPSDEEQVGVEETFIDEESDSGLTTEPLKLADEVETAETVESEAVTEETAPAERPARRMQRRTQVVHAATEDELERRRAHPIWTFVLIFGFVTTMYSTLFAVDTIRLTGPSSTGEQPSGMTAGFGKWVLEQFWGDQQWTKFHTNKMPENGLKQPPYEMNGASPVSDKYPTTHTSYKGPTFLDSDIPTDRKSVV